MKARKREKSFAKKLLQISCGDDGLLCEEKIRAVIGALPRSHGTLAILREYFLLVRCELGKQMLVISSPVELGGNVVDDLRRHFEQTLGQKFVPKILLDDSLIAGIRVRANDRIFEKSIAGALEALLATA
jgi:F0F1-type ATP synthase delta subunit